MISYRILTLNILNDLKDYKKYIHILNHILDLASPKYMKWTLEQYMLSVLHGQHHTCWCSGDFRSQGISRHGIDLQSQILSPAWKELITQSFNSLASVDAVASWNLTLYELNFSKGIKTFTFYVIPPHWHDPGTCSWNPSSIKTITYLFYIANIMAADVLVTQGARASATMIFLILNQINSVPAH